MSAPGAAGRVNSSVARRGPAIVAFSAAFVVAAIGGALTDIGPWYYALRKPSWQPPDWLFGPAWTIIFGLTALAACHAWIRAPQGEARRTLVAAFAVNAVLNIAWSALFFSLRHPAWALVEVGFLWLSIVALIIIVKRHSTRAAWLLAPYLAWVSFAAILNGAVVALN